MNGLAQRAILLCVTLIRTCGINGPRYPQYFSGLQKEEESIQIGDLVRSTTPGTKTYRVFSTYLGIRLPVELCSGCR